MWWIRPAAAAIALVATAAAAQDKGEFLAKFEGGEPVSVLTPDGQTQPVLIAAGDVPPPDCVEGAWFASADAAVKNVLVQCGSNLAFAVSVDSPAEYKPMRANPGSDWGGPMETPK
jgi:hypothetical protein